MSDWSDLAAFEQFNVVTRERDDLRAQLAAAQAELNKAVTWLDRAASWRGKIDLSKGPLEAQLLGAQAERDAAQAELEECTGLNRATNSKLDLYASLLDRAQAEVAELRRALDDARFQLHIGRSDRATEAIDAALSTPTAAQPLLDAVKLAVEQLERWCGVAPTDRDSNDVHRALSALERWVK